MPYDLFISYSRRDNAQGRITQLVERIKADFVPFAKRELVSFFDQQEIHGMQDWRQRILQGLRESRLLLACLSPAYLQSEYCEWEFVEYLKYEIGHLHGFNGVAPIYFVEVPGWDSKDFEQQCAAWVAELHKRQHFDLRPWHDQGEEALREAAVQEGMDKLNRQIVQTITRGERAEKSLGNVDAHNPHFIGRIANLRMLRENFVTPGHIGVVTAVNGVGGLGKTALAIEYAHAFADEYGGGRWQVRCAGKDDLRLALAELATPIGFEFTDDEKKNADLQSERTRRELKKLADAREPHRCLLLLDNVDRPGLLDPAQVARLNGGDWLHVLATTRLGENELHGAHRDRSFLAIDELPSDDALALIESYQPDGRFCSDAERDAAREIVRLLGSFTLAVESAAVYLGQFANDVTCAAFLARLKKEGLEGLDTAAVQSSESVLHGEKRLSATLLPTLERLGAAEKLTLELAALLPSDYVQLLWLRALVAIIFPEIEHDSEPGHPDPWKNVQRNLFSSRLIQPTNQPCVVRVHRIVQGVVSANNTRKQRDYEIILQFVSVRFVALMRRQGKWADIRLQPLAVKYSEIPFDHSEIITLYEFLLGRFNLRDANKALVEMALSLADFSDYRLDLGSRTQLLNAALVSYQHRDPKLQEPLKQLSILCRLGDVSEELGHLSAARGYFNECMSIVLRMEKSDRRNPFWACENWRFALRLGKIATIQRDFKTGKQFFKKSLLIATRLARANPKNNDLQHQLSTSEQEMGWLLKTIGNLKEAKQHLERANIISRRLVKVDSTNLENLKVSLEGFGELNIAEGDHSIARKHLEEALEISREMAKCEPTNLKNQRGLATSLQKLFDVVIVTGDFNASRRYIEGSLAIVQSLVESDRNNADFKTDMMYCYQRLAHLSACESDLPKALEMSRTALDLARGLAKIDPQNPLSQENLAIALFNTGQAIALLGREPEGRLLAIEGAKILARLDAISPLSPKTPAGRLFANIRRLAIL